MRIDWSKLGDLLLKVWPLVKEIIVLISASGVWLATTQSSPTLVACGASVDTSVAGAGLASWIAGLFTIIRLLMGLYSGGVATKNAMVSVGVLKPAPETPASKQVAA